MWQIIPERWFSWNFKVTEGAQLVADLDISSWRDRGELHVEGQSYAISRKNWLSRTITLEDGARVLATAERLRFFRHSYALEIAGMTYILQRKSAFGRAFVLTNDIGVIGTVTPTGLFSRHAVADMPADFSLPLRLFMVWLVLLAWKHRKQQAARSGGS
jgi:hypothetical protein